jgi:hypothetical protein
VWQVMLQAAMEWNVYTRAASSVIIGIAHPLMTDRVMLVADANGPWQKCEN